MTYLRIVKERKTDAIARIIRRPRPGITRIIFPKRFRRGKFILVLLVPTNHLRIREIRRIIAKHARYGPPVTMVKAGTFHCLRLVYDRLDIGPDNLQRALPAIVEWAERAYGLRAVPFPREGRVGVCIGAGMFDIR